MCHACSFSLSLAGMERDVAWRWANINCSGMLSFLNQVSVVLCKQIPRVGLEGGRGNHGPEEAGIDDGRDAKTQTISQHGGLQGGGLHVGE